MPVSDGVLTTACISGCPNRISWEYDQGEHPTRDHPGTDDEVWPASGCTDEHRWAITVPDYASRYHDVWQQLAQHDRLEAAAFRLWIASLQHIAGRGATVTLDNDIDGKLTRRRFRVPSRTPWEHDDLEALPL